MTRKIFSVVNVFDAGLLCQQNENEKDEMTDLLDDDFKDLLMNKRENPKIEKITCCVIGLLIIHTAFISYDE